MPCHHTKSEGLCKRGFYIFVGYVNETMVCDRFGYRMGKRERGWESRSMWLWIVSLAVIIGGGFVLIWFLLLIVFVRWRCHFWRCFL